MLNQTHPGRTSENTHTSVMAPELVFDSKLTRDAFDQGVVYGKASAFERIDNNSLYYPQGIPT